MHYDIEGGMAPSRSTVANLMSWVERPHQS